MNKVIISFLFFLSFLNVSAQETTTPTLSEEAYLKKIHAQKTTAWILLAGSTGLLIGSMATFELDFNYNPIGTPTSGNSSDNTTSAFLGIASLGGFMGSIAYFSLARENKKKAALVTLSRERIFIPHQRSFVSNTMPAIKLKISL